MGIELGRISGPLLARDLVRKNSGVGEENLAFETDLLYLDVINGRVGINTDTPSSPRKLDINGTFASLDLLNPTQFSTPNFVITTNKIQNLVDKIYIQPNQASDPKIVTTKLGTVNLRISDQLIENITSNSDINFNPNGIGTTEITSSELYVDGNLHSTGDITWDGDITFGNNNLDNVEFSADIDSHIIPNINQTYDLGTAAKRWSKIYSKDLTADTLTYDTITINNINLLSTQGNTYYVSVNGNDTYVGDHLHNTFRTIKHALSQTTAGDTVVIFPGTYEEIFPLTVPAGVTVNGAGIRAVTVKPTADTNTNNAFLLNGETTVSHLTVKDFYAPGNAFSFASGFTITSRSPYVQNITVITSGPNAGNGALVDGSLATSSSRDASLLFHSVTFIVPNSIGLYATNGARVEWLNSFVYFANIGIFLEEGTEGFLKIDSTPPTSIFTEDNQEILAEDGQTLETEVAADVYIFGAEIRSIGSANVYGTYGVVADGANTLAYLISHNFAYIGAGTDTSNDPRLVIQTNEVVELNNGKIYYESVDAKGDFRIGNIFYINQETGAVVFDAQAITFGPSGSISLEGPTSSAYIDYSVVQVGNIRIHDNDIDSLTGPVNFLADSGSTYLNTNVYVTGNTNVSADIAIDGNLFLGNQSTDTITVFPNLTQSLLPDDVGGPFTLGTDPNRWRTLYSTLIDVDGTTQITTNTISTLTTDTDLIFSAAGTGKIRVTSTDVQISNDLTVGNTLTVNGISNLKDITLLGNILHTGNWNQTGNTYITGLFANNNISITGTSYFSVPDIKLENNEISVTATDTDLNLVGLGTGSIIIDQQLRFKDAEITNIRTSPTTDLQKSIIFQPNGTGSVTIDSTKALTIPIGNNSTRTINIGEIRYNNLTNLFEGGQTTGVTSLNGLYDNDRNTYIRAGATDNTIYFGINNNELVDLNSTRLKTNLYHIDNISLSSNTINNRISGNDLIFSPNGTGNTALNGVAFGNGGNTITNLSTGPLTLESTGIGFIRFTGTAGLVLPAGSSLERRVTPEVGEVRYNTTELVTEVYSGDPLLGDNGWIPAIGTSGEISAEDVLDLLEIYTLVLG